MMFLMFLLLNQSVFIMKLNSEFDIPRNTIGSQAAFFYNYSDITKGGLITESVFTYTSIDKKGVKLPS